MSRVSKFCAVGGTLAVLTSGTDGAGAAPFTVHTSTPKVRVQMPKEVKPQRTVTGVAPSGGDEVIVHFENGDPDRPIITGKVYNGSVKNFNSGAKISRNRGRK
jgi:hypothetical protein